jgi:hypothetical protein
VREEAKEIKEVQEAKDEEKKAAEGVARCFD